MLPTPAFCQVGGDGLAIGDELSIDLEKGKTLILRYLALGEANPDGQRTVFFELNGQPRTVKVADRSVAASVRQHPKAEEGNPSHVAAPMPGLVVSLAVARARG